MIAKPDQEAAAPKARQRSFPEGRNQKVRRFPRGQELKEPVVIVVAQFLPSLFQAQTLAKKNRRELKGLVERDGNGETVKAEMKQVGKIISARRF